MLEGASVALRLLSELSQLVTLLQPETVSALTSAQDPADERIYPFLSGGGSYTTEKAIPLSVRVFLELATEELMPAFLRAVGAEGADTSHSTLCQRLEWLRDKIFLEADRERLNVLAGWANQRMPQEDLTALQLEMRRVRDLTLR